MSRRRIYSIAPHGRFLDVLADKVLDGTLLHGWEQRGPFWLADTTIILPTRRARLSLAEIFARRLGGAALLPDIRTLGASNEEEAPFLPPVDMPTLPVGIDQIERRLVLSRLVRQYAISSSGFSSPPSAAEVLTLSDSLAQLIDDLIIEGGDLNRLDPLMEGELAENWQDALAFLSPVMTYWPEILAERGKVDAARARNEAMRRQTETLELVHGARPVIVAGSTGSIPATAQLLKGILALDRGAIVLPGLDTSLTAEQHKALLEGANTESHPQFGLARLLRSLGAGVVDVEELAGDSPRSQIVRRAMATAAETAHWNADRYEPGLAIGAALAGVSTIAAPNADMEARAVALAARQAVATGRSVGIISRDQTLARRIAAELGRHGIAVDDPAGVPLFQSPAGRLLRQVLAIAARGWAPVDVIALLRNGAVTLGLERIDLLRRAGRLDLKLRRDRPRPGLAGLHALTEDAEIHELLDRLGAALEPSTALMEQAQIDAGDLLAALQSGVDALIGKTDTIGEPDLAGLAELRAFVAGISSLTERGAPFPPENLDAVLAGLMAGQKVQSGERRRDDVHIWGELEARLMNPDLMILAGVNDDIWPGPADPGPWLSRAMRVAAGLATPERQQGQAAHDFEMALGNQGVIIAYAERLGTSPAPPSRLLQRLEAFIGESEARALRSRGEVWLRQASAIDHAGRPRPATRPTPSPPSTMRPRRISVTEVETLMRSPYDIYARHVLKLKRLEPLGSEPSARERGTMIHQVFERFVSEGMNFASPDAAAVMLEMAREAFQGLESIAERRDIWLSRFALAAEQFLAWERARHGTIASRAAEAKGEWQFAGLDGFILSGKADRIDRRTDGTFEILDFKTGGIPQAKDMTAYEAPQLLLEAAMLKAGAFTGIPPGPTSALTYIKIGLGPAAFKTRDFSLRKGTTLMEAVDEVGRRAQRHIETFLIRDDLAMPARIRPRADGGRKPRPGDYDHLARTDEWTLTAGVDDP